MNKIDWKATLDLDENETLDLKDCVTTLAGAINILVDEHNALVDEVNRLEQLIASQDKGNALGMLGSLFGGLPKEKPMKEPVESDKEDAKEEKQSSEEVTRLHG